MKRIPALAFGLMVAATIGAFFLTQHLKSQNPLVWDSPFPIPAVFDPKSGRVCRTHTNQPLDYRETFLNFGISHADSVGVYIVKADDTTGQPVATVSSGRQMQASAPGVKQGTATFTWNGRESDGAYAPDGEYYFRISLQHEGRTIVIRTPVYVDTVPPGPRVLSVEVTGTAISTSTGAASGTSTGAATGTSTATTSAATSSTASTTSTSTSTTSTGAATLSPPNGTVTIRYSHAVYRRVWLDVYRTDVAGKPRLLTRLPENPTKFTVTWNGMVDRRPAPPGTYLIGITAQNAACQQASWPPVLPPTPGTTPSAGLTIRYLSVTPPLTPAAAGSRVAVAVFSQAPTTYKLRLAGTSKVLAHGGGAAGSGQVSVRLPKHRAGLYELTVRSAGRASTVPLVAYATGRAATHARVLVVLPALNWLGNSPVDDTGDGVPDTLRSGSAAALLRPLVDGLPAGFGDDAALLRYLRSQHYDFQITTDVALDQGVGPSLVDRWGVLFPDGEEYLPSNLAGRLGGFVKGGGRVLALGTGTFMGTSQISGFPTDPRAATPVVTKSDIFGAQRGPLTSTDGQLITELTDDLHLFGGAVAFRGFSHYQPIEPPSAEQTHVSAAGIGNDSPAIVAYPLGSGTVFEIGLSNFGADLARDVDSQELLANIWRRLAKLP